MCREFYEECPHGTVPCPSCGGEGTFLPFFAKEENTIGCRLCGRAGEICSRTAKAWHRLQRMQKRKR